MSKIPNRPCALGSQLGAKIAQWCDKAEADLAAQTGFILHRCTSCAFRLGTVPNGCATTQMDALKCTMEHLPFHCHEGGHGEKQVCAGYLMMTAHDRDPVEAYWKYSDEYTE